MPVFATPQPINVTIDVAGCDLRIIASDRTDTSVEVRPSHSSRTGDVKAAELTRVEYANGRLRIKGPQERFRLFRSDSTEVTIELPAGSDVFGSISRGEFRVEGRIGECGFHIAMGDFSLEQTGRLRLKTDYGKITVNHVVGPAEISTDYGNVIVDHVVGPADISTGSGSMRIRKIDGTATVKNSNGKTTIDEVTGELQFSAGNGDISLGQAHTSVTAKVAHGNIRIDEVVRGSIQLETSYGAIEVGIRKGTAAWLDVSTGYGSVRNSMQAHNGPSEAEETVEVRAHTAYGNVTIRPSTDERQKTNSPFRLKTTQTRNKKS